MPSFDRVILIVLDSVGIGEMPDAAAWGDTGSDTLGNIDRQRPLRVPNMQRMGLGNIKPFAHLRPAEDPRAAFGKAALASPGKDTTTGHWEMAGIILEKPFPLYPNGFPAEVIEPFERAIGRKIIGNKAASGTEIIKELGVEHLRTGSPIVYTSADSVFQVAAHEEVIPAPELYRICEIARQQLDGPHRVGRVIARPFTGQPGSFTRTRNRHDYAIPPPEGMLLDQLQAAGVPTCGVGKIYDIYCGRGLSTHVKMKDNADGVEKTLEAMAAQPGGFIFTNLVDFDMIYGHRNDVEGYAAALEAFDASLPRLEAAMGAADLLILTADHGCDPTTPSTDHSREYAPLLAFSKARHGAPLGVRDSLADVGQTVAENFACQIAHGRSFLAELCAAR
jgi:phosphopentomutase